MAGNYDSKKDHIDDSLRNWINEVISKELWNKYHDLHINDIDDIFKSQENWISGSLFLLSRISSLIDRKKYDFFLAIPLSCVSNPNTVNLSSVEILEHQLDITPPSFYLFPIGENNYEDTIRKSEYLYKLSKNIGFQVFYKVEKDQDEYYRTLFIK